MGLFRRCFAALLILLFASERSSAADLVATIERVVGNVPKKGDPTSMAPELGLRFETPISRAFLRIFDSTETFVEYEMKQDKTLRYGAKIPYLRAFRYQVRVQPEKGEDVISPLSTYEVHHLEEPRKTAWYKVVLVIAIIAGAAGSMGSLGKKDDEKKR